MEKMGRLLHGSIPEFAKRICFQSFLPSRRFAATGKKMLQILLGNPHRRTETMHGEFSA